MHPLPVASLLDDTQTFGPTDASETYSVSTDGTCLTIHCSRPIAATDCSPNAAAGNNIAGVHLAVPGHPDGFWASTILDYSVGCRGEASSRFAALGSNLADATRLGDNDSEIVVCFGLMQTSSSCCFDESLFLDTYDTDNMDGGPAFTTQALCVNQRYAVSVEGTYSIWDPDVWSGGSCAGTSPDAAPQFPSLAGDMTGDVGLDAEYLFSAPSSLPPSLTLCGQTFPIHAPIQFDLGAGWGALQPALAYAADHHYERHVIGSGSALGARRPDSPTDDNYGRMLITVSDVSPVLTAPPPLTIECNTTGGVSRDDPAIQAWLALAAVEGAAGVSSDAPELFASGCGSGGTTVVTFNAIDQCGHSVSATSTVTVQDTTPPEVMVDLENGCLWPPNHDFVEVATYQVTDVCDAGAGATGLLVSSDEHPSIERGSGGSQHCPDARLGPGGVELRAERAGTGDGRVYGAIAVMAADECGNGSSAAVSSGTGGCSGAACVPHDRSGSPCDAVDSGQVYDATDQGCP